MFKNNLLEIDKLICLQCQQPLNFLKANAKCDSCLQEYPTISQIPWIFKETGETIAQWQNNIHASFLEYHKEIEGLKSTQIKPGKEKFFQTYLQAKVENLKSLEKLVDSVVKADSLPFFSTVGLSGQLPYFQATFSYLRNVFRDWAWERDGGKENEEMLNLFKSVVPSMDLQGKKVAVLGAGAGRLPYDLCAYKPLRLYGVDLNPLLLQVALRMVSGRGLTLHEFPIAPRVRDEAQICHKLKQKVESQDCLTFFMADAINLPFESGSLDVVVTPWLIDILEAGPRPLMAEINRVLKKDGWWVNIGSIGFENQNICNRFYKEDLEALAKKMGFLQHSETYESTSYLHSPYSNHGRNERVWSVHFSKQTSVNEEGPIYSKPRWLEDFDLPIPVTQQFDSFMQINSLYVDLLQQIDQKTSIRCLAQYAMKYQMTEEQALEAVSSFIEALYVKGLRSRTDGGI